MTHRRKKAFTLTELLVALSVTSIIAMSIAGVSSVLSTAYAHSEDRYESIETARAGMRQLRRKLEKAALVTNVSDDGQELAYWIGDKNQDESINWDELRLIRRNPNTGDVCEYWIEFPDSWPEWYREIFNYDFTLAQAMNLQTVTTYLTGTYLRKSRVLAPATSRTYFALANTAPTSDLVTMEIFAGQDQGRLILRNAIHLRADKTDDVEYRNGNYVLDMD